MRQKLILIVCGCLLFSMGNSCSGRGTKTASKTDSGGYLPTINITKEYPLKEINIQDIANIEYIPLETTKESLLDGGALVRMACSDSLIVTCNILEGKILVFNRIGKFLHSFSHLGNGDKEYRTLMSYCIDFHTNEIFIADILDMHRILVYSLTGAFKRILPLPKDILPYTIHNFDNKSLLIYDRFKLDNGFPTNHINNKPYALLSKKDGEMTPLNFVVENRIGNSFTFIDIADNTAYGIKSMVRIFPISKNGSKIFVSDFARDTLYSLDKTGFTPIAVRTPTVAASDKTILFSIYCKTNRYTLMNSIEKNIDKQKSEIVPVSRNFIYDNQTGEINSPAFFNLDYSPKKQTIIQDNYTAELPKNYARHILSAEMLTQIYLEGHTVGKLKEVASKLKADDNPVLMLVKFKE